MASNYRRHYDQMAAYSPRRIAYLREQEALHAVATTTSAVTEQLPNPERYYYIRRRGQKLTFSHYTPGAQPETATVVVLTGSLEHQHIQTVNAAARQAGVLI